MTHGAIIDEDLHPGGWLFEFAAQRNAGLSFFAPQFFHEGVAGTRFNDAWNESFVRNIDEFGRGYTFEKQGWGWRNARYHPSWAEPFERMCRQCRDHAHIATPLDATDAEARDTILEFEDAMGRVLRHHFEYPKAKLHTLLVNFPTRRWLLARCFRNKAPATYFLSPDRSDIEDALALLPVAHATVIEQW